MYVEGEVVNLPDLVVPHPRWRDRAFVMIPLGELAPDLLEGWVDPDDLVDDEEPASEAEVVQET